MLIMINIFVAVLWANIYAFGAKNPGGSGAPLSGILFRFFRATYIPVATIAATLAIWNIWTAISLDGEVFAGAVVATTGVALSIWTRQTLGENYSPCFAPRTPREVVCSGPYAILKHPLYVGNLLVLAGFLLQGATVWLILAWIHWAITYMISARREAKLVEGLEQRENS